MIVDRLEVELVANEDKLPGSIRDAFDDSESTFKSAGEDAGDSFGEGFKSSTDGTFRDASGRLRDSRGKFVKEGESAGEEFSRGFKKSADKGGGFSSLFKRDSGSASALTSVTGQLSVTVAKVGAGIATWGPLLLAAGALAVGIAPAFAAALPLVAALGAGIGVVALSSERLKKQIEPLKKPFEDLQRTVSKTFTAGFGPQIERLATTLFPVLERGLGQVAKLMNAFGREFLRFLNGQKNLALISRVFTGMVDAIRPLTGLIEPLLRSFLRLTLAATPALKLLTEAVAGVALRFADFIDRAAASGKLEATITRAMKGLLKLFSGVSAVLGPLIRLLARLAPAVISGVSAVLSWLGKGLDAVLDLVDRVKGAVDGGRVADSIKSAFTDAVPKTIPIKGTKIVFDDPHVDVSGVDDRRTVSSLATLTKGFDDFKKGLAGFGSAVGPALLTTLPVIRDTAATLLPILQSIGGQILSVLGPALTDIGQIIATQVIPAFNAFLPAVTPVVAFFLNVIGTVLVGVLKGAVDVIKGLLQVIAGVFNVFAGLFTGDWSRLWQGVKQIFSGAWQAIVGVAKGVFAILKGLFQVNMATIRAVAARGAQALTAVWHAGLAALGRVTSAALNGVVSFFRGLMSRITGALLGAGSALAGVGRSIVQGLINGIRGAAGQVTGALLSIIPGPLRKFASALGIHSPSTVFARYGRDVVRGFVLGIDRSKRGAADAAGRLAAAFKDRFEKAQEGLASILTERSGLFTQIRDSAISATSITSIENPTSTNLVRGLRQQLAQVRSFRQNIARLMRGGLNDTTLRQLAEAGVESGSATAAALVRGGRSSILQVNRIQKSLTGQATLLGKSVSGELYKAGVASAQGLVRGLESARGALLRVAGDMGKKIAQAVRKALGIKSPSTVFAGIGENVALGLANGIDGGTPRVMAAAGRLAGATLVEPDLAHLARLATQQARATLTPAMHAPAAAAGRNVTYQIDARGMDRNELLAAQRQKEKLDEILYGQVV